MSSREEKIEKWETQRKQLSERIRIEEKRLKEQKRRERTQQLIKVGGVTTKILNTTGEEETRRRIEELLRIERHFLNMN